MVTKKKIIENELMKEIISIRIDALWKMLRQKKDGLFPELYEEGATGKLDNKGAIFIPGLFFLYCKTHFNLSIDQAEIFAEQLDKAQDPVITNDGNVLYQPHLIICHGTRYKENSLTGLTRLLGIGNFGEFATFSFEQINQTLTREFKRKHKTYTSEDIFAEYKNICILGILRIYSPTKIGKRPQKYSLHIVSPEKDIGLNMDQLRQAAQKRYHFRVD